MIKVYKSHMILCTSTLPTLCIAIASFYNVEPIYIAIDICNEAEVLLSTNLKRLLLEFLECINLTYTWKKTKDGKLKLVVKCDNKTYEFCQVG